MENLNNNLQELEELRSQVAEFKKHVEQQEIVSRRLLKEAMKGHVSWIKQMSILEGKETVRVKFRADNGATVGGIYDLRLLKP